MNKILDIIRKALGDFFQLMCVCAWCMCVVCGCLCVRIFHRNKWIFNWYMYISNVWYFLTFHVLICLHGWITRIQYLWCSIFNMRSKLLNEDKTHLWRLPTSFGLDCQISFHFLIYKMSDFITALISQLNCLRILYLNNTCTLWISEYNISFIENIFFDDVKFKLRVVLYIASKYISYYRYWYLKKRDCHGFYERYNLRSGTRYKVKWLEHNARNWEKVAQIKKIEDIGCIRINKKLALRIL